MARFREVKLEIVRPGPPQNQLLSPLTPYMALCGDGSPVTFHLDFEHRQLLNRLERLRYVAPGEGGRVATIPDQLREAEVMELGAQMRKICANVSSLNAELSRAGSSGNDRERESRSDFVHLRFSLSGSELSILPFELAIAPQAFPGEGRGLFLQGSLPIVLTREVRRSRPFPVRLDRLEKPRILFVCAEPEGMIVPKREHIAALRSAIEPWVTTSRSVDNRQQISDRRRLEEVKKHLRLLTDASIEAIYEESAKGDYTHVHILAHGHHYLEAGEQRFGVALCKRGRPAEKEVIDGERLAKALRAERRSGMGRSGPLAVTLATCDSGHPGSVLVPGGSIAHELHVAGIPWVFASQFPLTVPGSVRMTEFLYPRLLRGDDPRQVLYELRRYLHMTASHDHDWASVIAYASVPSDFEQQVAAFFEKQTRRAIEVQMDRADGLAEPAVGAAMDGDARGEARGKAIGEALGRVRELLQCWKNRLPTGDSLVDRVDRAACYGIEGSTYKRIGLLHASGDKPDEAKQDLKRALDAYRRAMEQWATHEYRFHWAATQYLVLSAVLGGDKDPGMHAMCRKLAQHDVDSPTRSLQAWAHGTLAELELIAHWHAPPSPGASKEVTASAKEDVVNHCRQIVDLMGDDSFQASSTRRQFQRYVDHWMPEHGPFGRPEWIEIAKAAVKALSPQ